MNSLTSVISSENIKYVCLGLTIFLYLFSFSYQTMRETASLANYRAIKKINCSSPYHITVTDIQCLVKSATVSLQQLIKEFITPIFILCLLFLQNCVCDKRYDKKELRRSL